MNTISQPTEELLETDVKTDRFCFTLLSLLPVVSYTGDTWLLKLAEEHFFFCLEVLKDILRLH
jgi:hypothetical protein